MKSFILLFCAIPVLLMGQGQLTVGTPSARWAAEETLAEALSIEGIGYRGGILYVLNDAYFHETGTMKNEMLTYTATLPIVQP